MSAAGETRAPSAARHPARTGGGAAGTLALDHAGLSVADLDAAVAFYGAAFGFEAEFAFELPGDVRGVMLRLAGGGRLELFEHPAGAGGLRAGSPLEALATRGYGHVAVAAPDIDAAWQRALEAGAGERVSPRPSPEPGVRFAFLADPEGNLVELVQRRASGRGRLAGKVCFITGTAGGQGQAAAQLFAAEGATVVGCDLKLDGIDLADPEQAAAWVDRGVAEAGGIDVLYNNASATRVGPFDDVTWEDWQFVLRNELDLIFTVTKAAWPHLKARGGVVINTASVSAWRGAAFTEQAAHGAAKGGVLAITRHLAASGAPHGIRANSISPGLIVTPQIAGYLEDPSHPMHGMREAHPLGRLGEPADVARVALFLASDDAAYLNAVDLVVDGGQAVIV